MRMSCHAVHVCKAHGERERLAATGGDGVERERGARSDVEEAVEGKEREGDRLS